MLRQELSLEKAADHNTVGRKGCCVEQSVVLIPKQTEQPPLKPLHQNIVIKRKKKSQTF